MKKLKKLLLIVIVCVAVIVPIVILSEKGFDKDTKRLPINSYAIKNNEMVFDMYNQENNITTGVYSIELPSKIIITNQDQISLDVREKGLFDDDRSIQEVKGIFVNGKLVWSSTLKSDPIKTKKSSLSIEQIKRDQLENPSLEQAAKDFVSSMNKNCKYVNDKEKNDCTDKTLLKAYDLSHDFVNKVKELIKPEAPLAPTIKDSVEVKVEVKE